MGKKKPTQQTESEVNITHITFQAPVELRNAFKSKLAIQGKTVREVMVAFMEEYVRAKK